MGLPIQNGYVMSVGAPMQQIADWLQKLGLGQYAQRFAENDITFSILADLTDQDLKEIGVSLGHRRQLLREIANLGKTAGAAVSAPALPEQPIAAPTVTPPVEAAGERRHVTVMFCDLVDSTGIAARLDAEEWRDLVGAYFDAASAAVTEMGGKVAKKLGDALQARREVRRFPDNTALLRFTRSDKIPDHHHSGGSPNPQL